MKHLSKAVECMNSLTGRGKNLERPGVSSLFFPELGLLRPMSDMHHILAKMPK